VQVIADQAVASRLEKGRRQANAAATNDETNAVGRTLLTNTPIIGRRSLDAEIEVGHPFERELLSRDDACSVLHAIANALETPP
jgi:hypothetical protein